MHDSDWIRDGTTSWPRLYGRESTVIPASSVFFGMYDPKAAAEYGFQPDWIDYITNGISDAAGLKKDLVENFTAEYSPKDKNKRELMIDTPSLSHEDESHSFTIMNMRWPLYNKSLPSREDVEIELENWRILDYSCGCGTGKSVGEICSMRFEYCSPWYELSDKEYDRILYESTEAKFYGKIMCRHIAKGLADDGRYLVFNKDRFYSMLPKMTRAISKALGDSKKIKMKEMDVVLNPFIQELGFGDILEYYRENLISQRKMEPLKEKLVRKLGSPNTKRLQI